MEQRRGCGLPFTHLHNVTIIILLLSSSCRLTLKLPLWMTVGMLSHFDNVVSPTILYMYAVIDIIIVELLYSSYPWPD